MAAPHLSLSLRRRLGALGSAEIAALCERIESQVEQQLEALGPRPEGWRALADVLSLGRAPDATDGSVDALHGLHAALFADVGTPRNAAQDWATVISAVTGAASLARAAGGSPGTAGLAVLLHAVAERQILRALAAAEAGRVVLDAGTRQEFLALHAGEALLRLSRRWRLPPAVAAAARDAVRVADGGRSSVEARAVHYARQVTAAARTGFAAPGLDSQVGQALGIATATLVEARRAMDAAQLRAVQLARRWTGRQEAASAG